METKIEELVLKGKIAGELSEVELNKIFGGGGSQKKETQKLLVEFNELKTQAIRSQSS